MGYWFDRNDSMWDVARVGLPSAAVVIYQRINPLPARLRRPAKAWRKGPEDCMYYPDNPDLWVRTLDEAPRYGSSLSDHYRKFFLDAFNRTQGCAGP